MKNRIQELRKSRKVTQQELADALSVTRQTIISLENGKYNASLVLAHKAAQFFGVSIEELFIFEGDENINITDLLLKGVFFKES
ncbi:MAG: helix-turn-helix transcriptional regulator [Ruminococcus sp.]|nr:helix-turn-helix transcriptional regulator [Ruminococcus sp.]